MDILIVESDTSLLLMLRDLLAREGAQVRTAADTKTGIEAIRNQAPDALFVSLDLGCGSAHQLAEAACGTEGSHGVPVVLLAGEHTETGPAALEAPLSGCVRLDKTDPETLSRDVRLLVRRFMPLSGPPPRSSPPVGDGVAEEALGRPISLCVFDDLDEGVIMVGGGSRVIYANPAAARLLERKAADLIGHPLTIQFSSSSREAVCEMLEGTASTGSERDLHLVTIGGRTLDVRLLQPDIFLLREAPRTATHPEEQTTKEQELSLLSEILDHARSSLPEEAIFPFLLEKSIEITNAEAGTVALLEVENGERGHLAFRYALGEQAESIRGIYIPRGQGIIGWCVSNDEPVIVNDVLNDQRFFPWVDQMSGFRTQSILCLPIRSEGEVFGALEIVNKQAGDFTRKDLDLLQTLADAATFNMKTALIQQRLVSQRDYYSGIMDSVSEGVMILRRDHRIADINQFFMMFLNLERSEIIGKTCHFVLKGRDAPCDDCFLKRFRIFEEGKDGSTIVELPALDGDVARFRVTGTPLEVRDEIINSTILTFHDVTRIHRLHDYLHASASVASLLLKGQDIRGLVGETLEIMGRAAGASRCYWYENRRNGGDDEHMVLQAEWCAPGIDSLQESDTSRRRSYADGFSRWLNAFSQGKILEGRTVDFPEEERSVLESRRVQAALLIPLFVRERLQGFIGFDNCTGARPWQEAEINLLQTTANLLSKAFEHDQSLKALRESEARYRDINENIYDAWYLHDMDGRFLEVNPAVERSAGYSEEELLQMRIQELIPPGFRPQFDRYLRDLRDKGVAEGVIRIRAKNGDQRVMEYRNWIVQQADGSPASRGLVRDITERMNLKSQLKHAQRMESIGTIATGISHNFRNLLAGIMTNCQLIQMKYRHIPEVDRYTGEIFKLTRAGSDLIKNLLQFSRKGSTESRSVINLPDVLAETHHLISRSFDKRFDIRTSWPELLPVYAEPSSLSQVFMNLCTNARDAMPEGGTLT
ncbi:MAG: PAS domain S-box protein [Deltaproteobacteria bacterium]|nr:PAS domain S-box protein [Deltaproteobacteria bacterium]